MINSRDINTLHPRVKKMALDFIHECGKYGIDLIVTSTYRDIESQNELYAHGRTLPGNKVTNAKGGESFHNYKLALDVVPLRNGKCVWGTDGLDGALWERVGKCGEAVGLSWSGRWTGKMKETCHFQFTEGLSLSDLKAGKMIKD